MQENNIINPTFNAAALCKQDPFRNMVQLALFLKSCGLVKEAAWVLAIRAINEAYDAQVP